MRYEKISSLCKKYRIKIIEGLAHRHMVLKLENKYVMQQNNKKIWQLKEIGKVRSLMVKKYKNNIYRWVHNSFGTNLRLTE